VEGPRGHTHNTYRGGSERRCGQSEERHCAGALKGFGATRLIRRAGGWERESDEIYGGERNLAFCLN
jgi:hypothetical protein